MKKLTLSLLLGATVVTVSFAKPLKVKPAVFDPDDTGLVSAAWVTHTGLPDAGKSDHALYLAKQTATATNAAALARIDGVNGIVLTEIGWDVKTGGDCGAGSPRFNVVTSDGVTHFIGCNSPPPITTLITDRRGVVWERRRYDPAAAFPPIAPGSIVTAITIVLDEGMDIGVGFTYLDNIDINGTLVGKPGNAKK